MASSLARSRSSRPSSVQAAGRRLGRAEGREVGCCRSHTPAASLSRGRATSAGPLAGLALAVALVAGLAAPAGAQDSGAVHLDAGLSHSLAPSGSPADPSTYGLGGLRLDWAPAARTRLFGAAYGGLGFEDAAGDWGSASVGFDVWTPAGERLVLGLAGHAQAFTVAPPFEYRAVEGELRPRVGLRLGEVWLSLQGRGGVGASESEIPDDPVLPHGLSPTAEVTADLWYWGGGPGATLPVGSLDLTVSAHAYEARHGDYRRGRVALTGDAGPLELSVDVGVWETPADEALTGGLTVRVPLGDGAAVRSTARRARPDPLLGTPAAGQGSVTGSVRLARLGGEGDRPLYRVERDDAAGTATVTFALRRPDAGEVAVLGDFTDWEPVAMERREGAWTAELEVEPGVHHFGFRVDGEWFVPPDAPGRTPDDWGRVNATLVVPR